MDILKIIFVIFLFTLSFGEILRFDLGNSVYIKPVDVFIPIIIIIWILKNLKLIKTGKIFSFRLFKPVFLVILVFIISLAFNIKNFSINELMISSSYAIRWAFYTGLYFVVSNFSTKFKEKIAYLLIAVGSLIVLLGFIQFFFYSNLRNLYYLGWDEHMYRMFSTFLDPNFAGAFFVFYLLFILSMVFYLLKNNRIKQSWILGAITFFTLISIFLTYSRSALIMLLVSTAIFSFLAKKIRIFIGIFIIGMFFMLISSKNFNIENVNLFRITSAEARLDSAEIALKIINNNLFLGVGFNTYRYIQVKYGFRDPINSSVSHADTGTDNSFLFIMATTGIIGLIFYLNLLWKLIKESYSNYKIHKENNFQKYLAIAAISSIGGIIVNSLFINSLFYPFIIIWMWVLLGIVSPGNLFRENSSH